MERFTEHLIEQYEPVLSGYSASLPRDLRQAAALLESKLSQDEQTAVFADYQAINQTPGVTPGLGLDAPKTAITVRVQDGKTLTTDGPFVEIKEAIGGYVVLMVGGRDEATEIAQRHPGLAYGLEIEVRQMAAHCHLGITARQPASIPASAR